MVNILSAMLLAIAASVAVHYKDYGWASLFALIFIMNLAFGLLFLAKGSL